MPKTLHRDYGVIFPMENEFYNYLQLTHKDELKSQNISVVTPKHRNSKVDDVKYHQIDQKRLCPVNLSSPSSALLNCAAMSRSSKTYTPKELDRLYSVLIKGTVVLYTSSS